MSVQNGKDYLYLIWKDPESRREYAIGTLTKNGKFEFEYGEKIEEAKKAGFKGIEAFKDFNKKYTNDILFPVFSSRLPDKKRKNIADILKKYNLTEYDEYNLLKNSGAKLPIDTLHFIDPIFDDENPISRDFYVAGPRHCMKCDGQDCSLAVDLNINDKLKLVLDSENKDDKYAVRLYSLDNKFIGYIPRYYSKQVTQKIEDNRNVLCTILEYTKGNTCAECIKVNLSIN